jgi:hypothetical protein
MEIIPLDPKLRDNWYNNKAFYLRENVKIRVYFLVMRYYQMIKIKIQI